MAPPIVTRARQRPAEREATHVSHLRDRNPRPRCSSFKRPPTAGSPGESRRSSSACSDYSGTMCEILRHDAGKWVAICILARLWRVDPPQSAAVGDDVNDIPMIRNAGLGVAMGHARPEVIAAADLVTGGHDEDGVAMLVENVLL